MREQYGLSKAQWAREKKAYEERMQAIRSSTKYKRAIRAWKKAQKQK
jgi:hypothetical protein